MVVLGDLRDHCWLLGQGGPCCACHRDQLGRHIFYASHRCQRFGGHFGGQRARREYAAESKVHGLDMRIPELVHLDWGGRRHGLRAGGLVCCVQQRPGNQKCNAAIASDLRSGRLLRLFAECDGRCVARDRPADAGCYRLCGGLLLHHAPRRRHRVFQLTLRHLWDVGLLRCGHLPCHGGISGLTVHYRLAQTRRRDCRSTGARRGPSRTTCQGPGLRAVFGQTSAYCRE
mmetsp:Transcript_96702/g.278276  ORF Transcript_96702/g.278276 Transcript_96702/m.278276 type:complete len:230 (+) Transcript_96702:45-734(+)